MKVKSLILVSITCALVFNCKPKKENEVITPKPEPKAKVEECCEIKGDTTSTYHESVQKWDNLKKSNGQSYIFRTFQSSWFFGRGSRTEIKVEKGIVTQRSFKEFTISEDGKMEYSENIFTEDVNSIGKNSDGYPAITIDQIYKNCLATNLSVDSTKNDITFSSTSDGILTRCGYTPEGCADDCFRGVTISSFEWLNE